MDESVPGFLESSARANSEDIRVFASGLKVPTSGLRRSRNILKCPIRRSEARN